MRLAIACLLLCTATLIIELHGIIIRNSDATIELDIDDWDLIVYLLLENNATGIHERIPHFSISLIPDIAGECERNKCNQSVLTSYPRSQWSPPIRSNFSNVYADNITSTGFRLNSTLPNNISLVYEIELLPNDTWKDVNCRKLFLSRNGAKISIRLENLDASSYFWQVPQPAFYLRVLFKTNMYFSPEVFPLGFTKKFLMDPVHENCTVIQDMFSYDYIFYDRRATITASILQQYTRQIPSGQIAYRTLHYFDNPDWVPTATQVANQDLDKPVYFEFPIYVAMIADNSTWVEWDPDLSVLFHPYVDLVTPTSSEQLGDVHTKSNTTPVIVGVIVAVIVVIAVTVVLVAWFVPRARKILSGTYEDTETSTTYIGESN